MSPETLDLFNQEGVATPDMSVRERPSAYKRRSWETPSPEAETPEAPKAKRRSTAGRVIHDLAEAIAAEDVGRIRSEAKALLALCWAGGPTAEAVRDRLNAIVQASQQGKFAKAYRSAVGAPLERALHEVQQGALGLFGGEDLLGGLALEGEDVEGAGVEPMFSREEIRELQDKPFDLPDEEDLMWRMITAAQTGDESAWAALNGRFNRLIHSYAKKFAGKMNDGEAPPQDEYDEAVLNMRLAFVKAVRMADRSKGPFFALFSRAAKTNALRPLIEDKFHLKSGIAFQLRDLKTAEAQLRDLLGREPTTPELQVAARAVGKRGEDQEFRDMVQKHMSGPTLFDGATPTEAERSTLGEESDEDAFRLNRDFLQGALSLARKEVLERRAKEFYGSEIRKSGMEPEEFFRDRAQILDRMATILEERDLAHADVSLPEAAKIWAEHAVAEGGVLEERLREEAPDLGPEENLEFDMIVERTREKIRKGRGKKGKVDDRDVAHALLEEVARDWEQDAEEVRGATDAEEADTPRDAVDLFLLSEQARERLAGETNREIADLDDLLAHHLGYLKYHDREKVHRLLGRQHSRLSLDKPIGEEDGATIGDRIASESDVMSAAMESSHSAFARRIYQAISRADQETLPTPRSARAHKMLALATGHEDAARGLPPRPRSRYEIEAYLGMTIPTIESDLALAQSLSEGYLRVKGLVGETELRGPGVVEGEGQRYRDRRDVEVTVSGERAAERPRIRDEIRGP